MKLGNIYITAFTSVQTGYKYTWHVLLNMIPLWARCIISGAVAFSMRWVFIYVPSHSSLNRKATQHWIPIIITFPVNTLLSSIMILVNMDAVSGQADFKNLLRAFLTLLWMCPANVLCTWLLYLVSYKSRMGKIQTYVCSMIVSLLVWVLLASLVYIGVLYTTETSARYGYNYTMAAVLGTVGLLGSILMNKLMPKCPVSVKHSGDGQPKWLAVVLSCVNAVLVIIITVVSDTKNQSSLTLSGLMMSVPFGMYVCFGYLWFPKLNAPIRDENKRRAERCRSILWPTCYGFRSSEMFTAVLPTLVMVFAWNLFWLALCISFIVAVSLISGTQAILIKCTHHSHEPSTTDASRTEMEPLNTSLRF